MITFNVLLAVAWAALTADFSLTNLAFGFVLGFFVLWLTRPGEKVSEYIRRTRAALGLLGFFMWELIQSNVRVAWEIITPGLNMSPAIVAIPLDLKTDAQITLLANMITLTPGTLSLDVSADRKVLYIHSMYNDKIEKTVRSIKEGFEKRILEVFG